MRSVPLSRALRLSAVMAVSTIGLAMASSAPTVHAAGKVTINAPHRIYGLANNSSIPVLFVANPDPITGENDVISITNAPIGSGSGNDCTPDINNDWSLSGCSRAQLSLNGTHGKLHLPGNVFTDNADPLKRVTKSAAGAIIDVSLDSMGGDSYVFHIGGTQQQINDTLAVLQFVPDPVSSGWPNPYEYVGGLSNGMSLDIQATAGDGVTGSADSTNTVIRIESINQGPDLTVGPTVHTSQNTEVTSLANEPLRDYKNTLDPSDDVANAPQAEFDVTDPDIRHGETDDLMMLVMVVSCGQFHLRGGAFTVADDIHNLLTNQLGLDTTVAAAIEAIIPDSVKNLAFATGNPFDYRTGFAGVGSLEEVQYALSQVSFMDTNNDETCHLFTFVTDLGNNGLPAHYVYNSPPADFEVPIPLFDLGITDYVVGAGSPLTVTVNQAAAQADPTNTSPIHFTATFSDKVSDFDQTDVTLGGTANPMTAVVTPVGSDGTTYDIAVSGMTNDGTVTASIAANRATVTSSGQQNQASTSMDNVVTYDTTKPSVTVEQAFGQDDPTNTSPINFTATFSEDVTGFTNSDVTLAGTAGATTATVTGGPKIYNIAVIGMVGSGTVIASVPAAAATDAAGNTSHASTSTDNTVTYDVTKPSVTINQAAGQGDPTSTSPINFTAVFSEPVSGFDGTDVTFSGTAGGTLTAVVTGGPTTYNVAVSGMTTDGTVIADIPAAAATDLAGNTSNAATFTDHTVTWQTMDTTKPTVTIDQAAAQADPTSTSPINFTAVFDEPVTGFDGTDVTLTGTAGGTLTAVVTGGPTTYNVAVSGMTTDGTVIANIPANTVKDLANNDNDASTSTDNTVTWQATDITKPTVTIDQAAAQPDPTATSPINFTVVFSEPVTGFTQSDVVLTGTASAGTTKVVTGSGPTYNVAVSGMSVDGTIIANIPANAVKDLANNDNTASTSTDNTVTFVVNGPQVTINQAAAQADPTNTSPIHFTVLFNKSVTGFTTADVVLSGTAGATNAVVSGSGASYDVAVSGMVGSGTVIATIPAGGAFDSLMVPNAASTSTDNTVTYDTTAPTVTIDQAAAQADPTSTSPINFTVVFSEAVTGFTATDVTLAGAAGATTAVVTGSGPTYNVAVSGMSADGPVIATVNAGAANDAASNSSAASTSTDNSVTWQTVDTTPPHVTINQAAAQADPTKTSPINFTVVFSEPVTGFTASDVALSGTAGATTKVVTGAGPTYNVAVSGMTISGTVIATIPAAGAKDLASNDSTASTSTDNTVTWDVTKPHVTINQAAAQADPTSTSPINFTVVFDEPVTGFTAADVVLSGTAGATMKVVSGAGPTYNVAVTGMANSGTVIANIPAAAAADSAGNTSNASTSTDNTVTWDVTKPSVTINQAAGQTDPTSTSPINFTVVFDEPVTGFDGSDIVLTGTAGATLAIVSGSGPTYNVAVSGMTSSGTVIANIPAGAASDVAGNTSNASTSTDNTVTYTKPAVDTTKPSVTINQAAAQADPTSTSPINFTVLFDEPVTGFDATDIAFTGSTAGGTLTAVVTGGPTTYNVAVSGMSTSGTVIANIPAGAASDAASNTSNASTSTDNTVTYTKPAIDTTPPTLTVPANIVQFNDPGKAGAVVTYAAPTTTGGTAPVKITCSNMSGAFYPLGVTTVSCTATDSASGVPVQSFAGRPRVEVANNVVTKSFTITVIDNEPPVIAKNPDIIMLTAFTSTMVTFPLPSATDNSGVAPAVTCNPASGASYPLGVTIVTCTAVDGAGNSASSSFTISMLFDTSSLPVTGSNTTTPLVVGATSLMFGVALVLIGGRRRRTRGAVRP